MRKTFAVELLRIPDSGCLVAAANGLKDYYTSRVATGLLYGIQVLDNTFSSTGSIFLYESGGNHQTVWTTKNAAGSATYYPRAKLVYTDGIAVSGVGNTDIVDNIVISNVFHLVLSGVGNATSGLGINIIYI